MMTRDDVSQLLEQARNYRRLGDAVRDRHTRLALLELAFEFEERARRLLDAADAAPALDTSVNDVGRDSGSTK